MIRLLSKLLDIRSNEWPRASLLYAIIFLATTGIIWGETIVSASFLNQIGVDFLPWFFVAKALISLPATMAYAAFADRVPNDWLLMAILGVAIAGIVVGLLLLGWGLTAVGYPLLYLLLFVPLDDIFATHWYTYVNGFYDSRAAKRIVPVISTGTRIAGIVAGLAMPLLNRALPPSGIIMIWLATLLGTALLVWLAPGARVRRPMKHDRGHSTFATARPTQRISYFDNIREGYRFVVGSVYLRWMAISALLLAALLTLIEYRGSQILLAELKTTADIANFIGTLNGVGNLIVLPIQLFLLSRIINRIGMGNAALIYPASDLLACGALLIAPGLSTAAISHVDRNVLLPALRSPIDSLLYNAVPLRVKGRVRAFIGGIVVPFGALIGGVLLLMLSLASSAWLLTIMIGAFAISYAATALVIRKRYVHALISLLEQEDYSFLFSREASQLSVVDPAMLDRLKRRLEQSKSDEFTIFMSKLISEVGGTEAISILGQTARSAANARVRAAILDVLSAADRRSEAMRQIYADLLSDPDGHVRQAAINGMEQLLGPDSQQFQVLALGMLRDPDAVVRMQVLSELAGSRRFYDLSEATAELDQALEGHEPQCRAQGVHILGTIDAPRATRRLIDFLDDPEDAVRLEAALAVERQVQRGLPKDLAELVCRQMAARSSDSIERVRQAAMVVLGRLDSVDARQALVRGLADASRQIRSIAVEALVQIGTGAVPFVHAQLDSHDPHIRKMAAVILSRVNRREFGGLITASITGNLLAIYTNVGRLEALEGCNTYPTAAVLQSAIREKSGALLEEIFFLLQAIHESAAIDVIAGTLRSEDPLVRANAIEAIESMTTPQTANLIAPLCDPALPPSALLQIGEATWDIRRPTAAGALQQVVANAHEPLLRAITMFVLGEIGAAMAATAHPVGTPTTVEVGKQAPGSRSARRHSSALDLFGKLANIASKIVAVSARTDESEPQLTTANLFSLPEIETMLSSALADPVNEVRHAARAAMRKIAALATPDSSTGQEELMLSTIEKIIFLKEVPFFYGMTIDQLKVLATVCEEDFFAKETRVFEAGEPGGTLYIIISGRIGIEQEKRKGSFARVATIEAHSYFGESDLFDNSPRSASAIALQDTLALRLRREPLIALSRQHPDLSLELINVLSQRLREANDRIADLTRTRPRALHNLFDKYE
jgi:HEAT repeat protein